MALAADLRQPVDHAAPLLNRLAAVTGVLEQAAEIDVGGIQVGIDPLALPCGDNGAEPVAGLGEREAVVEIGGAQKFVARVGGDPVLVERGRHRVSAFAVQTLGMGQKFGHAPVLVKAVTFQFGGGSDDLPVELALLQHDNLPICLELNMRRANAPT